MRKLIVFNMVSLDGFIADAKGDMRWAHRSDPEWNDFVRGNASGGGELLFGRVTYDMMASYWPTPMAAQNDPVVAKQMNDLPKVVFSRSMEKATWHNTTLVKSDIAEEVRTMKSRAGKDMVIFGSASIISQLEQAGLIDEYQLVVNPVLLGSGKSMFEGMKEKLSLKLTRTRAFGNGNVLLCYEPLIRGK